jgi:hypothetical protein
VATSGTVDTTIYDTRKLIDNAYGRCKIARQEITSERIEVARDWLYLRLQTLSSQNIPLWAVEREIIPIYVARQSVPVPVGVIDVLNLNLRRNNRLEGEASSSAGTAENAFDDDFDTICTTLADGWIQLELDSATRVPMYGFLPGASGTWSYEIQGSDDGVTFTTLETVEDQTIVDEEWVWFDIQGVSDWLYYRIQATDGTVLAIRELVFSNNPYEINMAPLNRDDYSSLPNKVTLGQPTQFWYDKQRVEPIITLWPAPGEITKYWSLTAYVHRQIEDVGSMVQQIEVRNSWYLGLTARLAGDLALVDKEVKDQNLIQTVMMEAEKEWNKAMSFESDMAPAMLTPNIRPYTR